MAEFAEIIVNKLFLGNSHCITQKGVLDALQAHVVISILAEDEYERYGVTREVIGSDRVWHRIILEDDESAEISEHFHEVHHTIRENLREGKNVIVHCGAAVSRSPTLILSYLMLENGWDYERAYRYVKDRRPYIRPNKGFEEQLKAI
jgi:protein-tyrosine phosphatase